jgi:phage terminase large subunit-like protein
MELPVDFDEWPFEAKQKFLSELKYNWRFWARPEQVPPEDPDWDIWVLLAGRGFGKTRTGAEYIKEVMLEHPGSRIGIIGQTIAAVRDVCVEGESGLLAVLPEDAVQKYNRSLGQLILKNGSRAFGFSGADPEKLRGFQSNYLWMDELAAWDYEQSTFDMALMGLRLGKHPRIIITTTPKPSRVVVDLVNRSKSEPDKVRLTTGSTFDNAANLPDSQLAALRARYEGTTLGRQELYAELILDDPNALWTRSLVDQTRLAEYSIKAADLVEVVVAIDPSMSALGERDSETGIIIAGRGKDGHGYILEDASLLRPTPNTWANKAIERYKWYQANKIVAEVNQGYDLVENLLHTTDEHVPIKKVYATRGGKFLRAEPIAALYEQGRVHHVGMFPQLEDQMTQWIPGKPSPDRLDALVWALTQLMLGGGLAEFHSPSGLPRLPSIV